MGLNNVVINVWRHSPISFQHVSLWCLLVDSQRATYQSNTGVQLRKTSHSRPIYPRHSLRINEWSGGNYVGCQEHALSWCWYKREWWNGSPTVRRSTVLWSSVMLMKRNQIKEGPSQYSYGENDSSRLSTKGGHKSALKVIENTFTIHLTNTTKF